MFTPSGAPCDTSLQETSARDVSSIFGMNGWALLPHARPRPDVFVPKQVNRYFTILLQHSPRATCGRATRPSGLSAQAYSSAGNRSPPGGSQRARWSASRRLAISILLPNSQRSLARPCIRLQTVQEFSGKVYHAHGGREVKRSVIGPHSSSFARQSFFSPVVRS